MACLWQRPDEETPNKPRSIEVIPQNEQTIEELKSTITKILTSHPDRTLTVEIKLKWFTTAQKLDNKKKTMGIILSKINELINKNGGKVTGTNNYLWSFTLQIKPNGLHEVLKKIMNLVRWIEEKNCLI